MTRGAADDEVEVVGVDWSQKSQRWGGCGWLSAAAAPGALEAGGRAWRLNCSRKSRLYTLLKGYSIVNYVRVLLVSIGGRREINERRDGPGVPKHPLDTVDI